MKKNLEKIGYIAEVTFDRNWKVIVKLGDVERYFYIFDSKERAIEKINSMN